MKRAPGAVFVALLVLNLIGLGIDLVQREWTHGVLHFQLLMAWTAALQWWRTAVTYRAAAEREG